MVTIHPAAWDFIAANARVFKEEVYGWLVGYTEKNESYVVFAYDCQRFKRQTLISAIPEEKEFWDLVHSLPGGYRVVGMYHSHPAGSEIFHSHIDDDTVSDYLNLDKNFISIVTNGKDTECFVLRDEKSKALIRVRPKLEIPEILGFTNFRIRVQVSITGKNDNPTPQELTSAVASSIYEKWSSRTYKVNSTIIGEKDKLKKIPEISIEFPALSGGEQTQGSSRINFQDELHFAIFHTDDAKIDDVDKKVRDQLLDRLNQKIMKGAFKSSEQRWYPADLEEIHYFQVPLHLYFSGKDGKKEKAIFLDKMIKRLF